MLSFDNVGPNPRDYEWGTGYGVYRTPGRTNSSHEERIDGWLGTTRDISSSAHGEFDSLEEAEKYISEQTENDYRALEFKQDDDCVALFQQGSKKVLSLNDSMEFLLLNGAPTGEETDEELENEWIRDGDAVLDEGRLHPEALGELLLMRDEAKEEAEEE